MPDWLTKEATSVALLAAIVPVVLTWFVEWLRTRRRRRTVRHALLVEARRIREELGGGRAGVLLDETDGSIWAATPIVHPWMHDVIVESADVSPAIVAAFLELDRRLGVLARQLEKARAAVAVRNQRSHELARVRARLGEIERWPAIRSDESLADLQKSERGLAADEELTTAVARDEVRALLEHRATVLAQLGTTEALLERRAKATVADALEGSSVEALAIRRRVSSTTSTPSES